MTKPDNITPHQPRIVKADRARKQGHKPAVVWLTGLPGSGKSTLAHALEERLFAMSCSTYVLDGDNVRCGLNKDLGFSPEDRTENIRRIGEVAKLMADAGLLVITAFISPYRADRKQARTLVGSDEFVEVYVKCPLAVCEQRDTKGLYRKARLGEIPNFTGISAPYEEPKNCEVVVDTGKYSPDRCVEQVLGFLEKKHVLKDRNR